MKHLIDDALKLGRATKGLLTGFSVKGRLIKAIGVSRPNWPETFCTKAADYLSLHGVKAPHQFVSKVDYLSYIDIQLTRYAANTRWLIPSRCPMSSPGPRACAPASF